MHLSIGIKALNEQKHIAAAVESALASLPDGVGEVIVADCGSADETVEIAKRYPISVVRLRNTSERSCGAGAQLAYQQSCGEFFYLMDGDHRLDSKFVRTALAYLQTHPDVGGVGGVVSEKSTANMEFVVRETIEPATGLVDRLDCGGLYRRAAIESVGYFSDRNLHAYEEFELGQRLTQAGWKLVRLREHAVDHYGHSTSSYALLLRRLISGYAGGGGEVLRASFERGRLLPMLKEFEKIRVWSAVTVWWLLLAAVVIGAPWPAVVSLLAILIGVPVAFLAYRRRSLRIGLFSFVSWQVFTLGTIGGLFRARRSPREPIACDVMRSPAPVVRDPSFAAAE